MQRFSFDGRFFGNDGGTTNSSFRHHSVAKRVRTKEDRMKKVGCLSMGFNEMHFRFLPGTLG